MDLQLLLTIIAAYVGFYLIVRFGPTVEAWITGGSDAE